MDQSLLSSQIQGQLSLLKVLLHSAMLTESGIQVELERQVRRILEELDDEPLQARQSVLDYLHLLGFGYLIEEQS